MPDIFQRDSASFVSFCHGGESSNTDRLHEELRRQGKITSTLDQAYLENLRQGVRYWDGSQWVKQVTKVKHAEKSTFN